MRKDFSSKMKIIGILLLAMLLLAGCTKTTLKKEEDLSLKIGVMPAVDSAPIFLAAEKGYFKELGLNVDVQVYRNANNRQSALQSGELDGTMTDLIAFVNNVQNGFKIKITTSTDGSFPILVNKDFKEKNKVDIGMMQVSVSNFLSEEFLGNKYEMNKLFIPAIPTRLEMIVAGKMDMAVIPEPMASMGQLRGPQKRVYKNKYDFMPEAMVFTDTAIDNKEKAIKLFHQAYNKAVQEIQENDSEARDVLIKQLQLKPAIKDLIAMPTYHLTRVPDQDYINVIVNWVEEVQGKKINVKYSDMVERKFVK